MKLNLGCGSQVVDGWINVDYSLGARLAKFPLFRSINQKLKLFDLDWNPRIYIHDLSKRFPWLDSSIDVIYSSHTLEHLSKDDGVKFLHECYRVLRQDGMIRIVVPDLRHFVFEYIYGQIVADEFVEKLGVLYGNSGNTFKDLLSPFIQFPHKCMYDNQRLLEIMDLVGFAVNTKDAFESEIDDIHKIELPDRCTNAVIVEGRKK